MVKANKASPPFSSSSSSPLCLLELAANNQICQFCHTVESGAAIDKPGYWYCRQYGNGKMALEQRTPAMVAALYGSYQVLSYILDLYKSAGMDVNMHCGSDSTTALHCAISGASESTVEIIRLLLDSGADPTVTDARGQGPGDLIRVPCAKAPLEIHLPSYESVFDATTRDYGIPNNNNDDNDDDNDNNDNDNNHNNHNNNNDNNHNNHNNNNEMFLSLFSSPESSVVFSPSSPSSSSLSSSPNSPGLYFPGSTSISSSAYNTDEFRMYSFKVQACMRAHVHDWTECVYAHPGENARRRDPRCFHYSCVPCSDFRKGSCKRGDACAYAHGVFESWLHPAQYRTRLCKDAPPRVCTRKVCFFAHSPEELRPLFIPSTMDAFKPTTFLGSRLRTTACACDISNTNTDTECDTNSPAFCFSPQARLNNNNNNNNNSNNMQSQPQYSPFRPPSSITQDPRADFQYPHVTTPSAFSSHHNLGSDLTLPEQKVNENLQKSASFDFRASKEPDLPWVRTLAKEIISRPTTAASDWGSPTGKPEWKVNGDQLRNFRKSTSFDFRHASEEPDLSWVQTLVKDIPTNPEATTALVKVEVKAKAKDRGEQEEIDEDDFVLCSWVERLHLDQIIA